MMFNNRIGVFEENRRLREENEQLKRKVKKWKREYYELGKKLKEVEKLLNQLLNSNTPSSLLPINLKPKFTSPSRGKKGSKPRGKPKGGNGGAKERPPKIDKTVPVVADSCPEGHKNIEEIDSYSKIIYEINEIMLKVIEYIIKKYRCNTCLTIFDANHPDLPQEGMMGYNLQAFLTELKHNFAGSYTRISSFLESLAGNTFSPQAIKDCIHRVASQLEPSYHELESEVRTSEVVGSDETSWPVNGEKWWLWVLTTMNTIFVMINKSRARYVITSILGKEFDGVLLSDCLSVYRKFAIAFQKCWAHLLRKTHFYAEKYPRRDIKKLHEQLSNLYDTVQGFLETNPTFEQRIWQSILYQQILQDITNYEWKSNEAQSVVANYLKEYAGQWLVGVIIPEVALTNNTTERGIRKVIPTRKLIGGHRTERGAKDFAIIETHRQTWRLRHGHSYKKLVEHLRQQNMAA